MKLDKLLIVDDDDDIRYSIKAALQQHGIDALEARDGNCAIAMVGTKNISGIILDIMMPKRSGILVLEYIRTRFDFDKPIFVLTANESNRLKLNASIYGLSGYYTKPFNVTEMVDEIVRTLMAENSTVAAEP
ncbi:MAG: response regulator [Planctomycetota bacterium]